MRRSTKARGLSLALPLLLATAPPEAEQCPAEGEGGAQIDPILLSGIESGRRTHVQVDAVVAEEVVQIGARARMLGAALRLPGENLAFPAGTALAPGFATQQRTCLPLAPAYGSGPAGWHVYNHGRLACLIDADGDGAFERVQMYGTDYAMHVPMARPYRMIVLPAPIRLVEDPLGQAETRRHVLRRIEIGEVRGDTAVLRVLHAFRGAQPPESHPWGDDAAWEINADGMFVYRLPPPVPVPIDRSDSNWASNTPEERTIALAENREVEVGGLRLRVERPSESRPPGWNIVPLAAHFPRWIHYGCGGRSIHLGVPGQ